MTVALKERHTHTKGEHMCQIQGQNLVPSWKVHKRLAKAYKIFNFISKYAWNLKYTKIYNNMLNLTYFDYFYMAQWYIFSHSKPWL